MSARPTPARWPWVLLLLAAVLLPLYAFFSWSSQCVDMAPCAGESYCTSGPSTRWPAARLLSAAGAGAFVLGRVAKRPWVLRGRVLRVSRDVILDEAWAVIGPLFPTVKATGRPPVDRRTVVEATAWRFRTGAPWRDVPERFGNWNTIYKNLNRWSEQGVWERVLEKTQSLAQQSGDLDWVASIESTIVRVHQHGATLLRTTGGSIELQEVR